VHAAHACLLLMIKQGHMHNTLHTCSRVRVKRITQWFVACSYLLMQHAPLISAQFTVTALAA
jgi:hypothetical protein